MCLKTAGQVANSVDPDWIVTLHSGTSVLVQHIARDEKGYQINLFLISPQKHMFWVLIMIFHNICFNGEIRKISTLLG